MTRKILTEDEIKKVLDSTTFLTGSLINKGVKIDSLIKYVRVNNGYIVTTSIWNKEGITIRHLSISNLDRTDPAECDAIATDILGEGRKTFPGFLHRNMFHYQKNI